MRRLARQGVYLAGRFTGSLAPVTLADDAGPVEFVLLPFVRAATVRHFLPDTAIRTYDDAVAAALATLPPAGGTRRVLVAHQFVTAGACPPQTAGSESCAVEVGTVEQVDAVLAEALALELAPGNKELQHPMGEGAHCAERPGLTQ